MPHTRVKASLAVLLFVLLPFAATWARQADSHDADSAAIKKLFADFNTAFNNHDAHTVATLFTADADFITVGGAAFHGSTGVEEHLSPLFSGRAKTVHREATLRDVRFLRPDTAVLGSDTVTTGIMGPDGTAIPPVKGLYNWIVMKQNGVWLITLWHESNPTTPAGQPPKS